MALWTSNPLHLQAEKQNREMKRKWGTHLPAVAPTAAVHPIRKDCIRRCSRAPDKLGVTPFSQHTHCQSLLCNYNTKQPCVSFNTDFNSVSPYWLGLYLHWEKENVGLKRKILFLFLVRNYFDILGDTFI